jgi:uncharacterized repeat protein (TIGR01451 family)
VLWSTSVGKGGPDFGSAVVATPDGGAVAAGSSQPGISSLEERFYLVKTDAQGKVFTSYLKGNVFRDLNKNCQYDGPEKGLEDWIVRLERQKDKDVVYLATDKAGNFRWAVDTGLHKVEVIAPHRYWQSCTPNFTVDVKNFDDTVSFRLPVQASFDCPRNEVSIATPFLRRCVDNTYTVRYCNSGTVPSQNTRIRVNLDPAMSFTESSIPGVAKGGGVYEFAIGTLNNGDCGSFSLTAKLNCESELKGSAHCVTARIAPDSFCNASAVWDGSIVAAAAKCQNDTVQLSLRNIGKGNMKKELGYVIAEDVVMLTPPGDPQYQFRLASGEGKTYWQQPATGQTYRIIAEQSEGYPGESYPTAAVEGCKDKNGGNVSLGFYTMFPEDDADAFVDTDCQESAEAADNPIYSKRGHPKGYDVLRYVNPETDLTYLIQFRNTGSSTVEQVVIRDTLPATLDPSTVFPGTASHAYDFQVYGHGIVQFTLSNLNLPPNSSAGEGFVQFRVSQKPNLPCGTPILNRAAVYFDYNAPVVTGSVRHTSCPFDDYVTVGTTHVSWKGAEVNVSPNPFSDVAQFEVKGVEAQTFGLELYDIQGRLIDNPFFNQSTFQLFRPGLPAGIIIYRLTADGKPVATGKIMAY